MQPLQNHPTPALEPAYRHTVGELSTNTDQPPTIVSISDIHGYLDEARSALLTLSDHSNFDPIVTLSDGVLHWADNNYVLVFNGDLVDRGPANEAVLDLVSRLISEAPPGRVRVTPGNHESIALSAAHFTFPQWYSGAVTTEDRLALLERIQAGHIVAAYRGYNIMYSHAGQPECFTAKAANTELVKAAADLSQAAGSIDDAQAQRDVLETYDRVLGVGHRSLKGPEAGLAWIDLSHLPDDAPPQVVGHTRQQSPTVQGNVYCQNVIRESVGTEGGECVFVETPEKLSALIRAPTGGAKEQSLATFS